MAVDYLFSHVLLYTCYSTIKRRITGSTVRVQRLSGEDRGIFRYVFIVAWRRKRVLSLKDCKMSEEINIKFHNLNYAIERGVFTKG